MSAPRRERDDRRSVGSHEKMMGALGRAAGANADVSSWVKPESVRPANGIMSKIDKQYHKGLITADERGQERVEVTLRDKGIEGFHK